MIDNRYPDDAKPLGYLIVGLAEKVEIASHAKKNPPVNATPVRGGGGGRDYTPLPLRWLLDRLRSAVDLIRDLLDARDVTIRRRAQQAKVLHALRVLAEFVRLRWKYLFGAPSAHAASSLAFAALATSRRSL